MLAVPDTSCSHLLHASSVVCSVSWSQLCKSSPHFDIEPCLQTSAQHVMSACYAACHAHYTMYLFCIKESRVQLVLKVDRAGQAQGYSAWMLLETSLAYCPSCLGPTASVEDNITCYLPAPPASVPLRLRAWRPFCQLFKSGRPASLRDPRRATCHA